jgi:hypothetical protein
MSGKPPTDRIWAVQKNGREDRGFWSPIGAGWQHADGEGMTCKFNFWPVAGQEIVIRKIKAKIDSATGEVLEDIPY